MITLRVHPAYVRCGIAGDCHQCAVALAAQDVWPGDPPAVETDDDFNLRLTVAGRSIVLPDDLRDYVYALDRKPRDPRTRVPILTVLDVAALAPRTFTLPDLDDPAWQWQCQDCDGFFDSVDSEGNCHVCAEHNRYR